tara:strand:+ start:232 stop:492 length:261 start_codon:yes stop_codon:yes gene_type:complete
MSIKHKIVSREIPLDRTILIYQKDLDNELTRYSMLYSCRPDNTEVAKVLKEKGFIVEGDIPKEYKLTHKGSIERTSAHKRLESGGR